MIFDYVARESDLYTGENFSDMIMNFKKQYSNLIGIANCLSKINVFKPFDLDLAESLVGEKFTVEKLINAVCKKISIKYLEQILRCINDRAKVQLFGRFHGNYFKEDDISWSRTSFMLINYRASNDKYTSVIIDLGSINGITCELLDEKVSICDESLELFRLINGQFERVEMDGEDESSRPMSRNSQEQLNANFDGATMKKRFIKTGNRGMGTFFTHGATKVMIHLGHNIELCPKKTRMFLDFDSNGVYQSMKIM